MKNFIAIDLMIDGSRQDYLKMKKSELKLLSQALGETVARHDDLNTGQIKPFLKLMKKVDALLARWEEEVK